jgi:CW-type Zinc Finger/Methyl-CpG binding domain
MDTIPEAEVDADAEAEAEAPVPPSPPKTKIEIDTEVEQPPLQPDNPPPAETLPQDPKPPRKKTKKSPPLPLPLPDASPDNSPHGNGSHQLVLYTPTPPPERGVPSIGAFTVQCASCFKWRLIPTKDKYEEIREKILQLPFVCERAREWRPEVSCEDREDISQDGSRLWAIDKPQIPLAPPGWERLIHIRGEGCTRFADVYYAAPNGKKLRSLVEVQRLLLYSFFLS